MVGLSVILESYRDLSEKRGPQILSKGAMMKPSSPTTASSIPNFSCALGFLDNCFLCKQRLLPGKDIYMYNGDKAFCSVECRYRQIFMDEEESSEKSGCTIEYTCSLAATSSPSPSSSSSSSRSGKGARTRANAFAYWRLVYFHFCPWWIPFMALVPSFFELYFDAPKNDARDCFVISC